MQEYTRAYLNPFKWAQAAYEHTIGIAKNDQITINPTDLTEAIGPNVPDAVGTINTDIDWNSASTGQLRVLAALYVAIEKSHSYVTALRSLVEGRLKESEQRIDALTNTLKGIRSNTVGSASTSIEIQGGDPSSIEFDSRFYQDIGLLDRNQEESVYRLKSTGTHSAIRSVRGFGGSAFIEQSLGNLVTTGNLRSIVDGSRDTFWSGVFYSPAPVRADDEDIPWLGDAYLHGYALMLTYYLDRPANVSEIFIDPISTEPLDLVSIRWTPSSVSDFISTGTFESSGLTGWSTSGTAAYVAGEGIQGTNAVVVVAPSGWVSHTFALAEVYAKSVSGFTTTVASGDFKGQRFELFYNMRGIGDCKAGARIVWLNSSGEPVNYKLNQDFPTGFFKSWYLHDIVPSQAVSGRIDVGIFSAASNASAYFDNVTAKAGEQAWNCNQKITGPTSLALPRSTLSNRFSFVFAQRNPRQERLLRTAPIQPIDPLQAHKSIDPSIQKTTQLLAAEVNTSGTGETVWAYRLGLRELDLRYREYVPSGRLVSLPLKTHTEIRTMWMNAEVGKYYQNSIRYFVYPFSDNERIRFEVNPYLTSDLEQTEISGISQGVPLQIFTTEEVASGWSLGVANPVIIDPRRLIENYKGTDIYGKLLTYKPIHLRKLRITAIDRWLQDFALWSTTFDPNAQVLYGVTDEPLKEAIRTGGLGSTLTIPASALTTREGYIPIKVTIKTSQWTAVPDTYGRPDRNRVRAVQGEILEETSVVEKTVEVSKDYLPYDLWLNSTTFGDVQNHALVRSKYKSSSNPPNAGLTLRQVIDQSPFNSLTYRRTLDFFRQVYHYLRFSGALPRTSGASTERTATLQKGLAYQTMHSPIISGPAGSFFRLYWYHPTDGLYISLSQNDYSLRPESGEVLIYVSPPSSGYSSVVADYNYLANSETEDLQSSVVGFATVAATSITDASSQFRVAGRPLPVTRNMTDYVTGKIPVLRAPVLDRLSTDYWPIIEYYINSAGEIVFARDFHVFGEYPDTQITIEYETLGIQPRAAIEVIRPNALTVSPAISNFSLRTRETLSIPFRELA